MKILKILFKKISRKQPSPVRSLYEENSFSVSQTVDEAPDYQVSQLLQFDNRPYVSILQDGKNE